MLRKLSREVFVRTHPFWGFLDSDALTINKARMSHLATLELPIEGKSVLEVGAGIGLLTGYFEDHGCKVLSTDARPENVAEIKRRYPARQVATLDLERPEDVRGLGKFDVVFCYGTLYHLAAPEPALKALSEVSDMILLETCLSPGEEEVAPNVGEEHTMNQAYSGVGSRPTRSWVLNRLGKFWGHGYISVTQPSHPDFPIDWAVPAVRPNTRAIFVGSKTALANPLLTADIPSRHRTA
jgi:SAM-dependent methyltransferase